MIIHTVTVTPFQQNARLLIDEQTREALVVDPGGEADRIMEVIERASVTVKQIFLTHSHIDHVGGVESLTRLLSKNQPEVESIILLGHKAESYMRLQIEAQAAMFGLSGNDYENCREPDVYLEAGGELKFGNYQGQVFFTPGHAPGHVVLFFNETDLELHTNNSSDGQQKFKKTRAPVLIAGDTLFAGSIGRTDLPGGDYATLISSIQNNILTLPDETLVLSGHGPETTVGKERRTNPFLLSVGV